MQYNTINQENLDNKSNLIEFNQNYPDILSEDNVDSVLSALQKKKSREQKDRE